METCLRIPEIKAFDHDVLLLIVPDSVHTHHTSITLRTFHIDMAIKLAKIKELQKLNKQWKRSLITTKLTMKEAQLVSSEDTQIVSKIDGILKIAKDTTIIAFGTFEVKGIIKTPNHYKCINVVVDNLPENQHCKDIVIAQQILDLKPGSNKIAVMIQNLSCRTLKIKKGMKIAHVEASNIVPPLISSQVPKNIPDQVVENVPENNLLRNLLKEEEGGVKKIFESLNLQGIESWNEQQQQSAKAFVIEYQHLFAMNFSKLGKTSLVQHDIKLDDMTPFKERYHRMPPHQYEEVKKHLQEMLDIGAIHRSTSPWASPVVLVCKKDGSLRFCIDLRKLHNRTIKDAQSLLRIEDSLDCLDGATIFISLGLQSGYWQVELTEASRPLTAFTMGPLGFYECV